MDHGLLFGSTSPGLNAAVSAGLKTSLVCCTVAGNAAIPLTALHNSLLALRTALAFPRD